MVEVSEGLKGNVLLLLQMKDLSSEEKGVFVRSILVEEGISQRAFGRKYNIPYSNVQDWVSGRQARKIRGLRDNPSDFVRKEQVVYTSNPILYVAKDKMARDELSFLASRLLYVLSKRDLVVSEKSKKLIVELKSELDKVKV